MFTPVEILTRVHGAPFTPFEIVTSAGDAYPVRHPELVIVGMRFVTIGLDTPQTPKIAERETRVAIIHITELRDMPVPVSAGNNGSTN